MLRELHISNLAIIEKVDIELAAGLNVFTGQTGAGKSLILGALELLLGLRGGGEEAATFVRPGCPEARVSGVFDVGEATAKRLAEVVDQPISAAEPVLITRRVSAAGRSSVSVNGSPVTAAMLREAGQLLVDIHGQHDQQFLLKPANQMTILDAFADSTDAREHFAAIFRDLRHKQHRLSELRQSEDRRQGELDLYRFQIEEIDKAAPQAGEYETVKSRYGVLKNATHLKAQSSQVLDDLSEGEDTLLDRLGALQRCVQELLRMDGGLADLSAQFDQAAAGLHDAGRLLSRYQDSLDVDPAELAAVEERLDVLNRLIHKYAKAAPAGGDPVEAVLAYRCQVGERAATLESDSQALDEMDGQIARAMKELAAAGEVLTRLRRSGARKLKTLVEAQFRDLEMHEATLEVHIQSRPGEDPQVDSSGLDEMDFLVRTNPGQELLPLRKIASGGEMSRIMLALKTILADKDQVSVLIFDEIDANIGDRLGATIGRKMRALAHGDRPGRKAASPAAAHQIICITHLSQIAACGDHHLQISKEIVGRGADRQTVAQVRVLEGEARVRELAAMMAGANATAATLCHARNLLADKSAPKIAHLEPAMQAS